MPAIRRHSLGLRIWHWLDALVVLALIATYFLRENLVQHGRYLTQRLAETGFAVSDEAARPIIREMVKDLWAWHIRIGYVLTALFVVRVILFFTDKTHPLRECWDLVGTARTNFDFRNVHNVVVRAGYIVFYALQLFMIGSGFALVFGKGWGIAQPIHHLLHESHETVMWFFVAFVILHVVGVFTAENTGDAGITSAMINGGPVETKD